jgi:hypothetical protein
MAPQKHIHKVKRYKYKNGEEVYFCFLPECKYKINVGLSIGKKFLCNRCDKPFIMNELSKRQAKPHCNDCTKRKNEELDTKRTISFDKDDSNSSITRSSSTSDPALDDLRNRLLSSIGDTLDKAHDSSNHPRVDTTQVEDDIL